MSPVQVRFQDSGFSLALAISGESFNESPLSPVTLHRHCSFGSTPAPGDSREGSFIKGQTKHLKRHLFTPLLQLLMLINVIIF